MSESEEGQSRTGFRKFAKLLSDDEGNTTVDPKEMLSSLLRLSDKADRNRTSDSKRVSRIP